MSQVVIDVRTGAIVVSAQGQKKVIPRDETVKLTINLEDSEDAETPDDEEWTEFERSTVYQQGKEVIDDDPTYRNSLYTVTVTEHEGGGTYLSIKANDRSPRHDWRHLQRIKNRFCGPEREGCELYPAESRLVDEANQFHLFVLPEGERFPFGFTERTVRDEAYGWSEGAAQRPRLEADRV